MSNAPLQFNIAHWEAWLPEDNDNPPDLRFLPALLRRRLGKLGRIALHTAWQCLTASNQKTTTTETSPAVTVVYATRHGEVARTKKLLRSLAENQSVSPTSFSLSVHNSIIGLYSIARHDTAPTSVISAGPDTLPQALIEAAGLLNGETPQVLLLYVDDELPESYAQYLHNKQPCLAVAVLLQTDATETVLKLGFESRHTDKKTSLATTKIMHPAFSMLDVLRGKCTKTHCKTERFIWQFDCHATKT